MFTFSFGSAMAATNYTASDYATALTAEMNNQLSYLASAKSQAVNSYTYNSDGYVAADGVIANYTKAAYEAAADVVIAKLRTAMELAINTAANAVPAAGTTTAPNLDVVREAAIVSTETVNADLKVSEAIVAAEMKSAIENESDIIEKTQAPITKAAVEAKINAVDTSKYSTTGKNYPATNITNGPDAKTLTAAEYVAYLVDEATSDINNAATDTTTTDSAKRVAYETAYSTFKTAFDAVPTAEDETISDAEAEKTVAGAVNNYLQYGITTVYNTFKLVDSNSDGIYELDSSRTLLSVSYKFYEAKTASKKATLFGVEIDNIDRITKTEGAAVNNAFYNAINASAAVVTKYAGTDASKVAPLWGGTAGDNAKFLATLSNAYVAADVYKDVVELGNQYKATYSYGVKQYDDEKVDAAVKKAEELVYADLNATFKDAEGYLADAASALNYSDLFAVNYEYNKFKDAIKTAQKKFYSDAVEDGTPTIKVTYGSDKTAEEDYAYLKDTYAVAEAAGWTEAANKAVKALANAESYADIETALATAKADMAKLMLKTDASAVTSAQTKYKNALAQYANAQKALVDTSKYTKGQFDDAVDAGEDLIDEAITVTGVEAAYVQAQALIQAVKTDDELAAAKEALVKQISALPYLANLTISDKDTVKAAYDAYKAYVEMPGGKETDITNKATLVSAMNKVYALASDEINDRINTIQKELAKLYTTNDADAKAIAAKRADIQALVEEANKFNDELDAIKKTLAEADGFDVTNAAVDDLEAMLNSEAKVWQAEYEAARALAVAATKADATVEDMSAALEAYNNLTDRQKYKMDASYIELINLVKANLTAEVKGLKLTAKSSAKKGSITVKWTVKGDASAADGYQVWKSTKQSSGYKKAFTTTKTSYKNTKDLKKGTRYYYKVRAYKVVDGKNVYSDWSNKAYRKAK